jgi:hypothetical protein
MMSSFNGRVITSSDSITWKTVASRNNHKETVG